jgi:hypothetical protein
VYLSRWAATRTANPAKAPVLADRPRETVRGVQGELHRGEVYYIKNRLEALAAGEHWPRSPRAASPSLRQEIKKTNANAWREKLLGRPMRGGELSSRRGRAQSVREGLRTA